MSILIFLFGGLSIVRTPTDIFPNIGIPVISVIWSYTGLPADDMQGRITTVYERVLTADGHNRHRAHRSRSRCRATAS